MSLREALALHDRHEHPEALREGLGDGYLYLHNEVFRNVRRATLAEGFTFTKKAPFKHVLPRLQLDDLYRTRLIPYRDNVEALRRLERSFPRRFDLSDAFAVGFDGNFVFHESVHCLVHAMQAPLHRKEPRALGQLEILDRIVAEAAANATETIASASTDQDVGLLYRASSFVRLAPLPRRWLEATLDHLGFNAAFKVLFLSFLFSNFLYASMSTREISEALEGWVELNGTGGLRGETVRLFRNALSMDPLFRARTTAVTLKKAGYEKGILELLDFDFPKLLERPSPRRLIIERFAKLIERP